MPTIVVQDQEFELVAELVKPDAKKRILVGTSTARCYHVYKNRFGQIILDPIEAIPAYEAWLFKNPAALASVKQGLIESAAGEARFLGHFSDATAEE